MENKILIGKITSAHGIKGEVKIMSFSQNPEDIQNYQPIFDNNNQEFKLKINSKAQGTNKDIFIVKIENISNRNDAEKLQNTELFINKNQLEESDENEFYYVDLIGLDVIDENKNKIGVVKDVMNYGAGDIIEIDFNEKSRQKETLQMFSFTDKIFPQINLKEGFIQFSSPQIVQVK